MIILMAPFIVMALTGLALFGVGYHYGRRTGKLQFYLLMVIGLGILVADIKSWKDWKHIEQGSVYAPQ